MTNSRVRQMDRKSHTAPLNGRCDHRLRKFYVLLATLEVPSEALLHPQKLKFSGSPEGSKLG